MEVSNTYDMGSYLMAQARVHVESQTQLPLDLGFTLAYDHYKLIM